MIKGNITLEGKRVRLIPASHEHLDDLFKASHYSELWTYSPSAIRTFDDMVLTINQWMKSREQGLRYPFVIVDKSTDEIVGSTSYLDISPQNRKLEIGGTWLDPKVWRTRVNTECKYLLLQYGFEQLDLIRVQFRTDARNERSNQAIQRLGAQFEGTLRQEIIMQDGYRRSSNVYSIVDNEWEVVKARLIGYLEME
ncbi:GNAT family N-acetyltransferase [Paenibacillus sp. PR3]|uniref:GNAT family N-acetyltransferase n=1 Tax=Paenibacillus terricola TaxID=2763503 RepID=A0ABR8MZW9_9BACL|nr:GNAT family protein [Paenibacillus terricola]MBD3920084.1 GNAT family N-acetyltransferase [Paenibacillus terricola]